jgi:hypothetical protein
VFCGAELCSCVLLLNEPECCCCWFPLLLVLLLHKIGVKGDRPDVAPNAAATSGGLPEGV